MKLPLQFTILFYGFIKLLIAFNTVLVIGHSLRGNYVYIQFYHDKIHLLSLNKFLVMSIFYHVAHP
jgi:hypothetical protein